MDKYRQVQILPGSGDYFYMQEWDKHWTQGRWVVIDTRGGAWRIQQLFQGEDATKGEAYAGSIGNAVHIALQWVVDDKALNVGHNIWKEKFNATQAK